MRRGRPPKAKADEPKSQVTAIEEQAQTVPIRKLWEMVHKGGIPVSNIWDRNEIEAKIKSMGYEDPGPYLEQVEDYWKFHSRSIGNGPISSVDHQGEWSATIERNGTVKLKHHYPNNLQNRVPGLAYADEVLTIPNLEEFTVRLMLLLEETDKIFDEAHDEYWASQGQIETQDTATESIHGADKKIEQLNLLAEEFGFYGPNAVSIQKLPFKLAEAIGIPTYDELGNEKTWGVMAEDVVRESAIEHADSRGPSYDRGPNEPPLI